MTLKPKLRTYFKFKEQFETGQYIKCCVSYYKRPQPAQFRVGVLPLTIEISRFKRMSDSVEERLYSV